MIQMHTLASGPARVRHPDDAWTSIVELGRLLASVDEVRAQNEQAIRGLADRIEPERFVRHLAQERVLALLATRLEGLAPGHATIEESGRRAREQNAARAMSLEL